MAALGLMPRAQALGRFMSRITQMNFPLMGVHMTEHSLPYSLTSTTTSSNEYTASGQQI